MFRSDGVEVLIDGALGNNDDALSLPQHSVLLQDGAHLALPVIRLRRAFRDENVICAGTVGAQWRWSAPTSPSTGVRIAHAMPAMTASQPQCRPMTSMTKARECEEAVEEMLSTASQMRWSAVAAPIVKSVPAISLSMLPTSPTIFKCLCASCFSCVILPVRGRWRGKEELAAGLARDLLDVCTCPLTLFQQMLQMFRPLCTQSVRSRQTAVSSTDDECVDTVLDEVVCGRPPAFELSECL